MTMDTAQTSAAQVAVEAAVRPVPPPGAAARIELLDILRGAAVLGILAVNALAFAWPMAIEFGGPPPWSGDVVQLRADWWVEVFFHDKARTLFSLLFGVSIFLVGGDGGDQGRNRLLKRRLLWLLAFGAVHGLVFWYGDILLHYAYCGLIAMTMRSWPAKRLLWVGGGITAALSLIAVLGGLALGLLPPEIAREMQPPATGDAVAQAVAAYRSGLIGAWGQNALAWLMLQGGSVFLILVTVPLMLLGLGLYKSGFLVGRAPGWVYLALIAAAGANLIGLAHFEWIAATAPAGAPDPTRGLAAAFEGAAPLITLGYASLLIVMTRYGLGLITRRLAPVGRMAFTNYLTQTLIMVFLFYAPFGPLWFGQNGPAQLWPIVLAIWAAQLIWSPLLLAAFEYGPFEWAWRSLSHGRPVRLRRVRAPAAP